MTRRHPWRGVGRLIGVVAIALVAAACFKADASTRVGADGAAATTMTIEMDLGRLEDLFGGFAEAFEDADEDDVEQPSLIEQAEESIAELPEQMEAVYDERPDLREKFRVDATIEDEILVMEIAALTDNVEDLEILYSDFLGTSEESMSDIYDLDEDLLGGATEGNGDMSLDLGAGSSGMGLFEDISFELGSEFRFEATPVGATAPADGFDIDLGGFPGLTPEITIEITAPGDVTDTNGEVDGRTVTWELDGMEPEAARLVSEVDPSATAGGLPDDDDDDIPVALAVAVAALAAAVLAVGVVLWRMARTGPATTDEAATQPQPWEAPPPDGPPTAPPTA